MITAVSALLKLNIMAQTTTTLFHQILHDYVYSKLFVPANSRARQGWDKFKITNIQFKLVESIRQIISYRLVSEEKQILRENNSLKIQTD